jgi:hypothetical protein
MGSPAKFLIHFPYNVMFRKTVYDIQGMQFGAHGHAEAAA